MIKDFINIVIAASDEATGRMMANAVINLYKADPATRASVYNHLVFLCMGIELRNPAFFETHPDHHTLMLASFTNVASAIINGDPSIDAEIARLVYDGICSNKG